MTTVPEPNLREIGTRLTAEVRALSGQIGNLDKRIGLLDKAISRGRHYLIAFAVALLFDIVVTGFVIDLSSRTTDLANRNTATIEAQCRSANAVRAEVLNVFETIRSIFPKADPNGPPDQLDQIVANARENLKVGAC